MKQKNFQISQKDERLTLAKSLGPAFEKMLMACGGALSVSIVTWQYVGVPALAGQMPMDFRLLAPIVALGWALMASTEVYAVYRAVKGDSWVFDRSHGHLEKNGVIKYSFAQLALVEVIEDKEDGLCHKLLVMPTEGKPITLEDNSDGRLEELVEVAQLISDFTGIKVVRSIAR